MKLTATFTRFGDAFLVASFLPAQIGLSPSGRSLSFSRQVLKALSVHTGGMQWGSRSWFLSYATWPLADLHVCDDRLILTAPHGAYEFPRDKILRLTVRRRILWRGVGIEHSIPDYPPVIVFSTFDYKDMYDSLTEAGFPLKT